MKKIVMGVLMLSGFFGNIQAQRVGGNDYDYPPGTVGIGRFEREQIEKSKPRYGAKKGQSEYEPGEVGIGRFEREQIEKIKSGASREEEQPKNEELFIAAAEGSVRKARRLLKEVSPNIKDAQGNSPLHVAKNLRMIRLLVGNGADVNAQNNEGITRLHTDVVFGRPRYVRYLLDNGARPTLATKKGVMPLHLATVISYYESPQEAIKKAARKIAVAGTIGAVGTGGALIGASILEIEAILQSLTLANYLGLGPVAGIGGVVGTGAVAGVAAAAAVLATVDIAVRNRIVGMLLQAGANSNAQDAAGNTPLHTLAGGRLLKPAHRHGGVLMAGHLIKGGAKRDIKNLEGQTAYDVAREYHRLLLMPVLNPTRPQTKVRRAVSEAGRAVGEQAERLGRSIESGREWFRERRQRRSDEQ